MRNKGRSGFIHYVHSVGAQGGGGFLDSILSMRMTKSEDGIGIGLENHDHWWRFGDV